MAAHNLTHDIVPVFGQDFKQVIVQLLLGEGPTLFPFPWLLHLEDELGCFQFNLLGKRVLHTSLGVGGGEVEFQRPPLVTKVFGSGIDIGELLVHVKVGRQDRA